MVQVIDKTGADSQMTLQRAVFSASRPGATVITLVTSHGGALFVVPHGVASIGSQHVVPLPALTDAATIDLALGKDGDAVHNENLATASVVVAGLVLIVNVALIVARRRRQA